MQSTFGKRLQSVSAYTVSGVSMLSIKEQSCWKLLAKIEDCSLGGNIWCHYFLNDEFEILKSLLF